MISAWSASVEQSICRSCSSVSMAIDFKQPRVVKTQKKKKRERSCRWKTAPPASLLFFFRHFHGGVYKIYSNPRPSHMPTCTFAPPAEATRNQEARNAACAAQLCCTTGRGSLLPLPLAHTTSRAVAPFQPATSSGFEFQAHFVSKTPSFAPFGYLDSMYRLDIQTGC